MESLAPELFDEIVRNIPDPADLRTMRLVNKAFNTIFTPPAFKKVCFYSTPESTHGFCGLSYSPLAQFVKELTWVQLPLSGHVRSERTQQHIIDWLTHAKEWSTPDSFQWFMNIQRLILHMPDPLDYIGHHQFHSYPRRIQFMMLCDIGKWKHQAWTMPLTTLTINNCDITTTEDLREPGFQFMLGRLKHLSISVSSMPEPIVGPGLRDPCSHFAEIWLNPTQPNLESLSISCTGGYFTSLGLETTGLEFQKLTSLELRGFLFGGDEDIEPYIPSPKLRRLLLQDCAIVGTTFEPNRGHWSDTINRFRQQLGSTLTLFNLIPFSYISKDTNTGELAYQLQNQWSQANDQRAVKELWDAIGQKDKETNVGFKKRCCTGTGGNRMQGQFVRWIEDDGTTKTGWRCVLCLFPGCPHPEGGGLGVAE